MIKLHIVVTTESIMKNLLILLGLAFSCILFSTPCPTELERTSVIQNDYRESTITNLAQLYNNNFRKGTCYSGNGTDSLFSTGFFKGLWASGFDPSGNLKVAASGYGIGRNTDFSCGPLIEDKTESEERCAYFTRAWKITRMEVLKLIEEFAAGDLLLMDIPNDILEWPAIGNPHISTFKLEEDLAPFFDHNEDGIYNPLDGDYPIVLTESPDFIPHQFRFYVINDADGVHFESLGDALQMEFQVMDFVVKADSSFESEKAIFTRLKCIYKGKEDLRKFKMGIWEDNHIGCGLLNYVGCSPDLNSTYIYNTNGANTMCDDLMQVPDNLSVVKSMIFTDHSLKGFSYIIRPNEVVPSLPTPNVLSYYNYMSGIFPDGTPLTYGGTGVNLGSVDSTLFAFPDFPNDANGWSMQTANFPISDKRTISTFLDTILVPGASTSIDLIDYILIDSVSTGLDVFNIYKENKRKVDKIR